MAREDSTPEELAASRSARVAARELERQQRYLAFLRLAIRVRLDRSLPADGLKETLANGVNELRVLTERAGGRIVGRKRPKKTDGEPCVIYFDECGSHSLNVKEQYEAFVLAAVIVRESEDKEIDKRMKCWKEAKLGSAHKILHEPDIRKLRGPFSFKGDKVKALDACESLRHFITTLDFTTVACVMNRPAYRAEFGEAALDESLPEHPYLVTLNFLAERLAMALERDYGGGRARLVAESRGPLEDAMLQYEFAALHIDGTSYVSVAWFRQAFAPGIEFRDKKDNISGLQLADLAARPCGDKVLDPASTPDRWPEFRDTLCKGKETAHSIVSLKVMPWDEKYEGLWES